MGRAAALIAGALLVVPLAAGAVTVDARCRDGAVQGAYRLRGDDGGLRVAGAYQRGRRTGSFIFWDDAGVRIAHVPYDADRVHGTLSRWHPSADPGREPAHRLEASYAAGLLHGEFRSWYPDGRVRTLLRYERGRLADARAFGPDGAPVDDAAARSLAAGDEAELGQYNATLDALVARHQPRCARPPARPATAA